MPTKLVLVRHGETLDNRNRIFQGQSGGPLSDLGREQAALLAARLAGMSAKLDALYTSDLERALETATILGEALGLEARAHPGVREVSVGAWEGLHESEVASRFPDEWAAWRRGEDVPRGGGERLVEVAARVASALDEIARRHAGGAVLVVSHGAAIKGFAAHVLSTTVMRLRPLRPISNTGVTVFERSDGGGLSLLVYDDTTHLGDALAAALRS